MEKRELRTQINTCSKKRSNFVHLGFSRLYPAPFQSVLLKKQSHRSCDARCSAAVRPVWLSLSCNRSDRSCCSASMFFISDSLREMLAALSLAIRSSSRAVYSIRISRKRTDMSSKEEIVRQTA